MVSSDTYSFISTCKIYRRYESRTFSQIKEFISATYDLIDIPRFRLSPANLIFERLVFRQQIGGSNVVGETELPGPVQYFLQTGTPTVQRIQFLLHVKSLQVGIVVVFLAQD